MGPELYEVSVGKLRRIPGCYGDLVDDEREFTPEFEYSIQRLERSMPAWKPARVGEPQGS
jgi:hypothetical protein